MRHYVLNVMVPDDRPETLYEALRGLAEDIGDRRLPVSGKQISQEVDVYTSHSPTELRAMTFSWWLR